MSEVFGDPISVYTDDDAIADGVLVEYDHTRYPYLLMTIGVLAACESTSDGRTIEQVVIPLFKDAVMAVRGAMAKDPTNDLIELDHTAAGLVWLRPNASGGITILHPADS